MKFAVAFTLLASAFASDEPAMKVDVIDKINKGNHGWKAHVSPRFVNATVGDVQILLGSLLSTDEGFDSLPERPDFPLRSVALPEEFDSRTAFKGCEDLISHVRDQSLCGSCWAFGSTEAYNDRRCVAFGDTTFYAAEDTLACCSGFTCGMSQGCNGGQPTSAWKWFKSKGVTTGGDEGSEAGKTCNPYPFAACAHHVDSDKYPACGSTEYDTPKCTEKCLDEKYETAYADDKKFASDAYSISGEEKIMEEIVTHGPVTAAFTVYDDFPTYQSGVYVHTSRKSLGGHAIEIVGYGVENEQKYWLVKNSWNEEWGDKGYFKILRGSNECGIEGTVSAGIPQE